MNNTGGPLAGIRVIEVGHILAGPYAGMLLADLGADVVKIEMPGTGDESRYWGPPFATYMSSNRNKRSIEVDLHTEQGQRICLDLIRTADVLVEKGKIVAVAPQIQAGGAQVQDCAGMIVMPGFVDTHRHMWQGLLRNSGADDLLLDYQDALQPADLIRYAEQLGLDIERFSSQLREHAGANRVAEDVNSADLSGVSGTPTFFINGTNQNVGDWSGLEPRLRAAIGG